MHEHVHCSGHCRQCEGDRCQFYRQRSMYIDQGKQFAMADQCPRRKRSMDGYGDGSQCNGCWRFQLLGQRKHLGDQARWRRHPQRLTGSLRDFQRFIAEQPGRTGLIKPEAAALYRR